MKNYILVLVMLLMTAMNGFAQAKDTIPETDILYALSAGNYEVKYCKYVYPHLGDSSQQVKLIEINFLKGAYENAIIISGSFHKKRDISFSSLKLFSKGHKIERTKEMLLAEECYLTLCRLNEIVKMTPKKNYNY